MTIEIQEGTAGAPSEVIIQQPTAEGWLAFTSSASSAPFYWTCCWPSYDRGVGADYNRYPAPLFQTREDAIEQCRKSLPNGGNVRLIKVKL